MVIFEIIWSIAKTFLGTPKGRWILAGLAALLALCAIFYGGMHYEGLREASRQKAAIETALEKFKEQAEKDGLFTTEIETIKIKIVEKEIEVIKDAAKTNLCVNNQPTPDFRMLYNRSIGIANTTTASKPNGRATQASRLIASK